MVIFSAVIYFLNSMALLQTLGYLYTFYTLQVIMPKLLACVFLCFQFVVCFTFVISLIPQGKFLQTIAFNHIVKQRFTLGKYVELVTIVTYHPQ